MKLCYNIIKKIGDTMTKSELQRAIYRLTFDTGTEWTILKGESVTAMPITKDTCTIHFTNLSDESDIVKSNIGG